MSDEVIADTSFVVAVAIKTDRKHLECLKIYQQYERIYIPQAALAEIAFMLTRAGDVRATAHFLRYFAASKYDSILLEAQDFVRTAEILDKYADIQLDFVDATIAAVAERMKITRILTLDQRDFQILRPKHAAFFEILP